MRGWVQFTKHDFLQPLELPQDFGDICKGMANIMPSLFRENSQDVQSTSSSTKYPCSGDQIPAFHLAHFQKEQNSVTAFYFRLFFKPIQLGIEGGEQPVRRQWLQIWSSFSCWAWSHLLLTSEQTNLLSPWKQGLFHNPNHWPLGEDKRHFQHCWEHVVYSLVFLH